VSIDEVFAELRGRFGVGGHTEKAARTQVNAGKPPGGSALPGAD
jgi:hypothetical protein